jgi:tetratricopeptide (TPR) repeat protein
MRVSGVRGTVYLLVAAGLVACGAPQNAPETPPQTGILSMRAKRPSTPPPQQEPVAVRKTREEIVDETIEEYERLVAVQPVPPEQAHILLALGNLYRQQKLNTARAAQWYQEWVDEFATEDNPQAASILAQLVMCYEELGDDVRYRAVLRKMMALYPEDAEQYRYARKLLQGEDTPKEEPVVRELSASDVSGEGEGEGEGEALPFTMFLPEPAPRPPAAE